MYDGAVGYFNNLGGEWRPLLAHSTVTAESSLRGNRIGLSFQSCSSVLVLSGGSNSSGGCRPSKGKIVNLCLRLSPSMARTRCHSSWVQFWETMSLQFKSTRQLNWNWLFESLRIWTRPDLIQEDKRNVSIPPGDSAPSSLGLWLLLGPIS